MAEFVNKLFKYQYRYYVQGGMETGEEYVLMNVPKDASFNNNKSTLFHRKNKKYQHEIDIDTVVDLTINF